MAQRIRWLRVIGLLVVVLAAVAAFALSYNSPCGAPAAPLAGGLRMRAVVHRCYGSADVLKVEEVARPAVADNEILVRIRAASVNPLDWHYLRGEPYLLRLDAGLGAPKDIRMGEDFAGTVEAVGRNVRRFKVGEDVFGARSGAFAEYLSMPEDRAVVLKPAGVTFEQAAAVPIAAVSALQALRDHGNLRSGQKVLINGASGGVGTFAVQIAKAAGAEVTGVCSTRNVERVRALGADHVVDYTREDFTAGAERYDLIVDNVGNHGLLELRRVLRTGGAVVSVGGPSDKWLVGPLIGVAKGWLLSRFVKERFGMMLARMNRADLETLSELMQQGKLIPVVDRHYALADAAGAIRYVEAGHAQGKVIVDVP
jgi:NADPH:quinone reductase-like Zn-dependent oxidoreductase